jgi:DNA polymerase IV
VSVSVDTSGPQVSDVRCPILHVDMDAFFAAVEVLDNPELVGLPVVVGGTGGRGVVASCTYEARAFGIHSAMSTAEARRRCPHAVFLAGRYDRYATTSERLLELLRDVTPVVEPIGLDEAFLDVSGAARLLGEPVEMATSIREQVRDDLGLWCAVGVARTKLVAKLASRAAKPTAGPDGVHPGRGVVVVEPQSEDDFLLPLPVRALWGIGPATGGRLAQIGVETIADLREVPRAALVRLVGQAHGGQLAALAWGDDGRRVEADRAAKSIGHEETFATDLHTHADLHRHVVRMSDAVGARLAESGLAARTVSVKVRFADLSIVTRSQTVMNLNSRAIAAIAAELIAKVDVGPGVRLLGVSVSNMADLPPARQLSFDGLTGHDERVESGTGSVPDPGRDAAWDELNQVMGEIRSRYGHDALAPARLAGGDGVDVKRRGERQWGPPNDPGSRPAGGS